MRTITGSWRTYFRTTASAGLMLLLSLTYPSPAAAKGKADWARVEAVPPGTKTMVVLYKDRAPSGNRKIEGHFRSATAQAVTLLLPDGQRRTLQKPAVRKVLVYRPLMKRYQGWLTMAVAGGVLQGLLSRSARTDNVRASTMLMVHGVFVPSAGAVGFLAAPKMGSIYDVPIKRRDDTAQTLSSETASLLFSRESRLDQLRLQARRAVMRKDIPLDLSSLPIRGAQPGAAQ